MYGDSFVETSSAADWEKRGDDIMKRCLYDVAAKCYKMAGHERKEQIATASSQLVNNVEDSPIKLTIDPSVFDNLEWEVECTADVWKTLKDKKVMPKMKQQVIERIKSLASGEWSTCVYKSVPNAPPTLKLFETKLSKAARIIWELATAFSPRLSEAADRRLGLDNNPDEHFAVKGGKIYSEIIRVWDIVLDHDHLNHAVTKIIKSHNRGQNCILHRNLKGIKDKQFSGTEVQKRVPMLFAEENDDVDLVAVREDQQSLRLYPPASPEETEYHILKFYSFSSTLVLNILQNHEMKVDFPFRVTDTEHAIINLESKSPILLLGRSGTGKTTCCLNRLWTLFTAYWIHAKEAGDPLLPREHQFIEKVDEEEADNEHVLSEEPSTSTACKEMDGEEIKDDVIFDHLHQLFVTKNTFLCSEIHKNFSDLCHASDIAEEHVKMENDTLPNILQDVNDFLYPLFLTSRQLLLILDASLNPPYFFNRNDDGSLKVVIQGWGTQEDLFGYTPLDHDSDDEQSDDDDDQDDMLDEPMAEHAATAAKKLKMDPRREVTYDVFANEVWPKICKKSSVDYHPMLVWTEIKSFIRGSFEAVKKPNGILEKDEYIELGRKRAPNFSGERHKIYQLFLEYNHFKKQKFLFDESDLIYSIYKRLCNLEEQPWVLHGMYVDETQDFTQAELAILIRITQNPNNMFLTGDTAQSIMRGISFRFSDLQTLFYYAKKSLHAVGKTKSVEVPNQMYQLTHNYRSHAGILSLASAILDLMVEYFPESFDRLKKEQGLFPGPQPGLLEYCSPVVLAFLLQGHKRETSHIEFGAHQAILVVNDAARDSIPEELRLGLILTIYEAKGLEFDDVLLYNFFKDSYASKEWRVVTEFLEKLTQNMDTTDLGENLVQLDEEVLKQPSRPRPLTFNPNQHKVLNSELKHLYTALTRARANVWIFDESEEKRAPMFEYFKARRLVRVVSSYSKEESVFAETSSAADWEKRGDDIMKRCLYDVAAKCYKMAGHERKEKIATASSGYGFEITFLECDMLTEAALCLRNVKEYELAAQVFEKSGQFTEAARMYQRSKKPLDCSQCYEKLGHYNKAVDILYKEEMYDKAIDCLRRYTELMSKRQTMPQVILDHQPQDAYTEERLTYKSAELHARQGNKTKMTAALERLSSFDDKIKILVQHNYHDDAVDYLVKKGKTKEAAQLMLKNGEPAKALTAAEKGRDRAIIGECHFIMAQSLKDKTNMMEEVVKHLNKAVESFEAAHEKSGQAKALMVLANINRDKDMAKRAVKLFQAERPYSNEAGQVEAIQVVMDLSNEEFEFEDYVTIILGIEMIFRVIKTLIKQSSYQDKARAKLYYRYFGLYETDAKSSQLEIHPNEKPRCIKVIKDLAGDMTKKEAVIKRKGFRYVSLSVTFCFVSLSMFLLAKTAPGTRFVLPATYLAAVDFVDLSFAKQSCPIQELVHLFKPNYNTFQGFQDHLQTIVEVVCGRGSHMSLLQLYFMENKDDYLAAERCLVLTMVFLVNIGFFLPALCEDDIMKTTKGLQLPMSVPRRLSTTLQAVGRANGPSDIAAILQDLLYERENEHLLDCWWSWNARRRQGVQHHQLTDLSRFPKEFLVFGTAGNRDTERKDFSDANSQSNKLENDVLEEEEMTVQDRERVQKEHEQLDRQDKENEASKIILRLFKSISMKYRIGHLTKRVVQEILKEFDIKETFCGVCGVPLNSSESEEAVSSSGNQNDVDAMDSAALSLPAIADYMKATRSLETLKKHQTSQEHIEKNNQFEHFKKLYYEDEMLLCLSRLGIFVHDNKLCDPEMKSKAYADVSADIDQLLSDRDKVQTDQQNIVDNHSWEKTEQLRHDFLSLQQHCKKVQPVILKTFQEYQSKNKETTAKEQPCEPSPDVEEEETVQHEDVVPPPKTRTSHNQRPRRRRRRYPLAPRFK
ncbi:TPR and ankyrin repeat-containing protein 1-like [Gigantopelta aegis]|uniref:TPR and ankyrin repeat-containing protein 1-like n=1 Tax=Gigantopelta aegis TaxID=1735272 RepID=UPI001B88AD3B|nr:TPR and ankyrin repeat-containing protein 1-like [Gigantopelta aegis]